MTTLRDDLQGFIANQGYVYSVRGSLSCNFAKACQLIMLALNLYATSIQSYTYMANPSWRACVGLGGSLVVRLSSHIEPQAWSLVLENKDRISFGRAQAVVGVQRYSTQCPVLPCTSFLPILCLHTPPPPPSTHSLSRYLGRAVHNCSS